jgi:hypothetical protein
VKTVTRLQCVCVNGGVSPSGGRSGVWPGRRHGATEATPPSRSRRPGATRLPCSPRLASPSA